MTEGIICRSSLASNGRKSSLNGQSTTSEPSTLLPNQRSPSNPSPLASIPSNHTLSITTQPHTPANSPASSVKMAANTTPHTLDYTICTPSELRDFITNRRKLNASDSDALGICHKSHLVACLQSLDKNATFRFSDLAPEIRLAVYQHLLVRLHPGTQNASHETIETAIMRTCKAIYLEAEPVLYGDNAFTVAVNTKTKDTRDDGRHSSNCNCYHYIAISRPGHFEPYVFVQDESADQYATLSDHMASSSCFDMLCRVRHLDIFIGDCMVGTQKAIAALCMMLSGTIQMKTLTLVLKPSHGSVGNRELAKIFWPFAFVDAELGLACAAQDVAAYNELHKALEGLDVEAEGYWEMILPNLHHGLETPGDRIAKARARASKLTEQHGKDWLYLRHTDLMMSEIVRCLCNITASDQACDFVEAWECLASYVHEDDQTLGSLEKMAKDAPRTFPARYMDHKKRDLLTGGWALQIGVGGWS